jgi:hypothetical protein
MGKANLLDLSFGWTSNTGPATTECLVRRAIRTTVMCRVAAAARIALLAIAKDTLGSIRVPAAM